MLSASFSCKTGGYLAGFRVWIIMSEYMLRKFQATLQWFQSGNRKSKTCPKFGRRIQNRKWLGLSVIAFMLVVGGVVAQAQQPAKVPRIGYLTGSASLSDNPTWHEAFRQGLRELGYVEGKNIVIEWRSGEGKRELGPALAGELARLKVDVIVTVGSGDTRAAKEATATIPIVMIQAGDPVGAGFVASLARPGGNITGLSNLRPELSGKRLELLKEIVPKLTRVAVFPSSISPDHAQVLKELDLAAGPLGVKLQYLDIRSPKDFETAFQAAAKGRAEAVLVRVPGPILSPRRTEVAALAVKRRLPVMYERVAEVEAGGLMSYGVIITDLHRRAATFVDKILKGAKPSDLPVEQPTKFEFIINLKAAKQIGLTIPPNVLARADKVIR
jgi:putative tryptophan/tyrosine transport system substrate-binding protein